MTTDLDRLELELRCIPGVIAVGLDRDSDGRGLLVQVVVLASDASPDLRSRVRRVVDSNVREPVSLEIIVDMAEFAPKDALIDWTARAESAPAPAVGDAADDPAIPPDEAPR